MDVVSDPDMDRRVMWNTGAADATGTVVGLRPFGVAVERDDDQHNGGAIYELPYRAVWEITEPKYERRAFPLPRESRTVASEGSDS